MELEPIYDGQPLTVSHVTIRISSEDQRRVTALVNRTSATVGEVTDAETFQVAKKAAGDLKSMSNEIMASKRAAKEEFEAILAQLESLSKQVVNPVNEEQTRIGLYLNKYVAKLEAAAKEAERKRRDELKRQEEAHQAKIREMEAAKTKADEAARQAQDEISRERAKNEAARRELALAQAELERALELEVASMTRETPKGLVHDGRVNHPWKFVLVDPVATVKAGCVRLLRVELNHLNCQDSCKAQLEIEPDKDPQLPGIEVSRGINVSIKASRIS
jgi:hypothetical protein